MVKSWTELPAGYCSPPRLPGGRQRPDAGPNTRKASSTINSTAVYLVSCNAPASPEEHIVRGRECAGSLSPAPWTLALGTPASGKEVLMLFPKPSCSQPDQKP